MAQMTRKNYRFAPESTIPMAGTVHRQILDLMADIEPAERHDLVDIDDNFRRIIQELEGERYGFWAIDRIHEGGSKKATHYQVNARHFHSNESDSLARAERRVELRRDSLDQAMSESGRVQRAFEDFEKAKQLLEEENAQQS